MGVLRTLGESSDYIFGLTRFLRGVVLRSRYLNVGYGVRLSVLYSIWLHIHVMARPLFRVLGETLGNLISNHPLLIALCSVFVRTASSCRDSTRWRSTPARTSAWARPSCSTTCVARTGGSDRISWPGLASC